MEMVPAPLFFLFALVLGLVLGSFYTVCVHRYITGASIVWPGSHCPLCDHKLAWWENIPILSYMALRGRCRSCRCPISIRYPVMEAISGLWALALAIKFGPTLPFAVYLAFGGVFIVASFIDFELFILPDVLTLPGALLAFVSAVALLGMDWQSSLLGALFGAGLFLLVQKGYYLIKRMDGLGTGDIKLMLLIGALLGWQYLPVMILLAATTGLVASLFYLRRDGALGMKTAIPFGPFLCLGAMLSILAGERLLLLLAG
jgi:leader peptidase (prepilin peptidase) / N-methyltransferase